MRLFFIILLSIIIFSCEKEVMLNDNPVTTTIDTLTEETKILTNELKGNYLGYGLSAHSPFEFVPKLYEDSTYMIENGTESNWEIDEISLDSIGFYKSYGGYNTIDSDTLRYRWKKSQWGWEIDYLTLLRKEKIIWTSSYNGHNVNGFIVQMCYFKKID